MRTPRKILTKLQGSQPIKRTSLTNASLPFSGFLLTRQKIERGSHSYLCFWFQTDAGPVKVVTEPQQHVFFAEQSDEAELKAIFTQASIAFEYKSLGLATFSHHPVSGFYFHSSQSAQLAKEVAAENSISLYESDIKLQDRFLMERFVYASAQFVGDLCTRDGYTEILNASLKPADYRPKLCLLSIDIECSEQGQLYSIGLVSERAKSVIMIGPEQAHPDWITWVDDEKALLVEFVNQFNRFDADIIVGWSVINFDCKLLFKRAKLLNIPLPIGRDGSAMFWRENSNQGYVSIAGRVVIDGIDALKTATYQFASFSLESVSQALLGKGKLSEDVDNRMAAINRDFIHNKVKLAEYNLQDCQLVLDIFAHTKLLDFLILRSRLTGLELDRIGGSVAAFINLYLPKLHRAGYVSPNRPQGGGLASPGGYVMNSIPGLYQHVLVLDFKSLYPSIIRTFKIDPMGLVEGLNAPDDAIPGYRGAQFSRHKHFLPDIIEALWQQRDQAKRQGDAARSQAIKILMNSFYGVLGSGGCPFYDTRLASSITLRGHDIMQTTAEWIKDAGYQVIYGDTDSTFVWLEGQHSQQQAFEIGKALQQRINHKWQEKLATELNLTCHLEIEFETYFSQFLMPTIRGSEQGSKKRYAGIKSTVSGQELVFKGLESVRSDWTAIAKSFQHSLYTKIFNQQDVKRYINDTIKDIRQGRVDDQLIYRKRLRQKLSQYTKNVPPHVKAARLADKINGEQGQPLKYQSKGWINYWITLNGPEPVEHLRSPIDYEHYIEKQIKPIAEGILPFINLSFEQLTSKQLGLF